MIDHSFGGDWTEDKLERLKSYLVQYRRIFDGRARYFRSWYVDAFAGSGSRKPPEEESTHTGWLDEVRDAERYRDGSAKIALSLDSPFDRYLFIEERRKWCKQLRCLIKDEFPQLSERCDVLKGDANDLLCTWIEQRDWRKDRAVVFLDPYGMQVEWRTIQALGATKGVDLWYLFPLSGVFRVLKKDGEINPKWKTRLTKLFGTTEWEQYFYSQERQMTLLGETDILRRDATVSKVQAFIDERLRSCFVKTSESLILKNSNQSPLFLLCCAAANEKGAPIAIRIANSILSRVPR